MNYNYLMRVLYNTRGEPWPITVIIREKIFRILMEKKILADFRTLEILYYF